MLISQLLETCGLNPSEQIVLVELLSSGELTASEIAKRVKLKRTNVYAVLDNLQNEGLVSSRTHTHVKHYLAAEPELICGIFQNRARESYDQVLRASELLNPSLLEISKYGEANLANFQFSALESKDAVFSMLELLFEKGNFCAIFDPETVLTQEMRPAVSKWLAHSSKKKTLIREVILDSPLADWYCEKIENPNHLVKRISRSNILPTDMLIEKESVTILSYQKEQEVAVKIAHKGYAESMQTLFEMIWKQGNC